MPRRETGSVLDQPYPKAVPLSGETKRTSRKRYLHRYQAVIHHDFLGKAKLRERAGYHKHRHTHKSAPMVALYWLLNRLFTYWFMSEVLPTLRVAEREPRCTQGYLPTVAKDNNLARASQSLCTT